MGKMPPIIRLIEIDSTNLYLADLLIEQKLEEGTVVCTDYQTAGKGQRGNVWESAKGQNLMFSMLLYPTAIKANEQFILSQLVSLAIKISLESYIDGISIKWPNDIYWQEKKIGGILIENKLSEDSITQSIVGIGLNINQTVFESNAPNPISLKQITGITYKLDTLMQLIINSINTLYINTINNYTANIIKAYKESLFRNGGYHLYSDDASNFLAQIIDVEPSGILVLETKEGERKRFAFKEVKYILQS